MIFGLPAASGRGPGGLLERLRPSWRPLGASLGRLGAFWNVLEASWWRLWGVLGHLGDFYFRIWAFRRGETADFKAKRLRAITRRGEAGGNRDGRWEGNIGVV